MTTPAWTQDERVRAAREAVDTAWEAHAIDFTVAMEVMVPGAEAAEELSRFKMNQALDALCEAVAAACLAAQERQP